jgi:hypothetical protein
MRLADIGPAEVAFLDTGRVTRALVAAPTENDRFHFVQIIESHWRAGAIYAPGPLLEVALHADHPDLISRALDTAWAAAESGPVTPADLATISALRARPRVDEFRHADLEEIRDRIEKRLRAR